MPWEEHGVMEERLRFVDEWQSGDWNMAELCRFFGVTRATGYKWLTRYEEQQLEGLRDRSRAPHHHPNALPADLEDLVVAIRGKHPTWGAPKIRACLERDYGQGRVPAESTIGALLHRLGLTVPRKRRAKVRRCSEPLAHADGPNRVWCADYKGWFRSGDGRAIYPLTISDAHSRYLLRCQALPVADHLHSRPVFQAAFQEYGLPQRIRTDNGAPFGSNGESALTELSVWFIRLGIMPERIQPGKPQQNGRHERMHRTLKQETASPPAATPRAQQKRFDHFRREYNEERPHEALGQQTPASCYQPSQRCWPRRLPEIEYPADWITRRVSRSGQMKWLANDVFVAHALHGERVGLEQIDERRWRVWFSFYEIGMLDAVKLSIRRPERSRKEPLGEGGG
jgi:transposase InsO family protein